MAIMGRGILQRECERHLDDARTVLGLLPILLGGTPEQCGRIARSVLEEDGSAVGRPSAPANREAAPTPLLRRPATGLRTIAKIGTTAGSVKWDRKWVLSARGGIVKVRISYVVCRTGPRPLQTMIENRFSRVERRDPAHHA